MNNTTFKIPRNQQTYEAFVKARTAGETWDQIALKYNASSNTVLETAKFFGLNTASVHHWTSDMDEQVISLSLANKTKGEIATMLNKSVGSIERRFAAYKEFISDGKPGPWDRLPHPGPIDTEMARFKGVYPTNTTKLRKCLGPLCHGELFQSSWVGERVCLRCRDSIANIRNSME